jgi:RES domain-containing protein
VNLKTCRRLRRLPVSGTWYRALELQFLKQPLQTRYSRRHAGRFSPGPGVPNPFDILYLCEHQVLSLREVEAVYGSLEPGRTFPNPQRAWVILNVQVVLQPVVDLTDREQLQTLGTSVQELTGDWRSSNTAGTLAPTQQLGVALYHVQGIEGFVTVSAKSPQEKNLNIFPAKLKRGSRIRFRNEFAGKTHSIEGKLETS